MIYNENCFENWSERMESDYLSQDFEPETETCCSYDCDNEATERIGGDWYCEECAKEIKD